MKKITIVKHLSFSIALFCAVNFGFGQTTLAAGDIAITGFNSGSRSQFTFVLLKEITINTQIKFTDKGWNTSTGFLANEGTLTWESDSDLPCGTEVFIERQTNALLTTSSGTLVATGTFLLNGTTGDQILAYQDLSGSPSFIYSIHFGPTSWLEGTSSTTTAIPPGLTDGDNAVYLGNFTFGNYTCTVTSNQSLILAAVSTATNWFRPNTRITALGGCAYTCVPCPTIVTWNGTTWFPSAPTLSTTAVINGTYTTNAINGSFSSCGLTVNGTLNVTDGYFVEAINDVIVDGGTISLETNGAFVQRGENTSAGTFKLINGGQSNVFKFTAPKLFWYYYTYWSSPVEDETVVGAFPDTNTDRRFLFNAEIYRDIEGDGYDEVNGWQIAAADDPLIPGVGYAATAGPFHPSGGIDSADFNGAFNTGDIPTSIFHDIANRESWNLIGNPYPCAIDFNAFYDANSDVVEGVAYYWSQASPPDALNPGNEVLNFSQNDYAIYSYGATAGVMGVSGVEPTPFVPSAQSFFIEGKKDGIVTFTNEMRMADGSSNNLFFKNTNTKSKTTSAANKVWIDLTSDNGVFCQTLMAYVEGATNGNDGSTYDAPKLPTNGINAVLYSIIEDSNKNFAIQCKDVNSINEDEIINLGFKSTIDVPTLFKLSVSKLQGDFLTSSPIYLKDHLLNKVHDLSVCDYTFTSEVGEFNSRFEIAFTNKALSVNDVQLNTKAFKIVELQDDLVQFNTNNNLTIKAVNIYDLLGRALYQFKGKNTSETFRLSNLNNTVYIAKVALSDGTVVTKKAVKK